MNFIFVFWLRERDDAVTLILFLYPPLLQNVPVTRLRERQLFPICPRGIISKLTIFVKHLLIPLGRCMVYRRIRRNAYFYVLYFARACNLIETLTPIPQDVTSEKAYVHYDKRRVDLPHTTFISCS